jgi:ribosomal protein S18 acetylase RimI-like enzyme
MHKIETRTASLADVNDLRGLFVKVVEDLSVYCEEMRAEQIATYTTNRFEDLIGKKSVAVAVNEGAVVGFMSISDQGGPGWIDWVLVDPEVQRKNVAQNLLDFSIQHSRNRGIHKIWCDTRTDNHKAYNFFRRNEFIVKCELKDHWHHEDYFIWEKFI